MPRPRKSEDEKRQANAIRKTRSREKKRAEAIAANRDQSAEGGPANPRLVVNEDVRVIEDIAGTRPLDEQRELRWEEGFRHEELDGEDSEDNSADALRRLHGVDEPSSIITASEAVSVQAQQDHELDGLTLLMNRVAVTETQRPSESPLHVNDTYAWEEDASNSSSL